MDNFDYHAGDADTRPWGNWRVLGSDNAFVVKRIEIAAGQRVSLQYHEHRSEHWVVVAGQGLVTIGGDEFRVSARHSVFVPRQIPHRVFNDGKEPLIFIEVQIGDHLAEDDIVRLEDDYCRC
ncbi:phosphomannose isomerase type II C-terminal cupin domain [uncultured Cohaesibacter sp.]|uniref:phosphomannose isomerase type II C-terminal cupin domain n=1 Tax=uncultured Cohaesibacter sp. TaxID=1002546 RepID=UPI00374A0A2E